MRWKSCVLLPAASRRTQFFLLIFTEPGAHHKVHPCTWNYPGQTLDRHYRSRSIMDSDTLWSVQSGWLSPAVTHSSTEYRSSTHQASVVENLAIRRNNWSCEDETWPGSCRCHCTRCPANSMWPEAKWVHGGATLHVYHARAVTHDGNFLSG